MLTLCLRVGQHFQQFSLFAGVGRVQLANALLRTTHDYHHAHLNMQTNRQTDRSTHNVAKQVFPLAVHDKLTTSLAERDLMTLPTAVLRAEAMFPVLVISRTIAMAFGWLAVATTYQGL